MEKRDAGDQLHSSYFKVISVNAVSIDQEQADFTPIEYWAIFSSIIYSHRTHYQIRRKPKREHGTFMPQNTNVSKQQALSKLKKSRKTAKKMKQAHSFT